jgi:hypothetical protein
MKLRHRKLFVVAASALASMALVASAAEAAAPAAPYQDFAGCPSRAENPFVGGCVKYTFSGGKIGLGNREIPVTNPIFLRGGFEQITGNFIYNAEGGIVPAKQAVPGGLTGMTGWSWLDQAFASKEQLKLYATVELAGRPSSVNELPFTVPVKVHLENPALGSSCYVGSNTAPLTLQLTNGTTNPPAPNKPISGEVAGEFEAEAARPEVFTTNTPGKLVDNAYAVPGANGCQLKVGSHTYALDQIVDAAYKLPAAAGKNTTTLTYTASIVDPGVVYP